MLDKSKNSKDENQQKDLETLLAELGGGIRIVIRRLQPSWCAGYIETIELGEDETLSLEDIRSTYGGRKLEFKFIDSDSGKIITRRTEKFPDPPKEDGVIKENNTENKKKEEDETKNISLLTTMLDNNAKVQQAIIDAQEKNTKTMMEMQQKQTDTIQKMMNERLRDAQQNQAQNHSNGFSHLKESMELIEFIEGLRDKLKNGSNNDENAINPMTAKMMSMAEKYFSSKLEREQVQWEAEMSKKYDAPPLPDRQRTLDDFDDETLMREARERFHQLPISHQKRVVEEFLSVPKSGSQKSDNSELTGLDVDDDIDSFSHQNEDIGDLPSQVDLDSEDRDVLDSARTQTARQETSTP